VGKEQFRRVRGDRITPAQCCERGLFEHPDRRTAQEEVVELAPADGVADNVPIPRLDGTAADEAGPEPGNLLEREPCGAVLRGLEIEKPEYFRRHPSTAHFVSRKLGSIEH